MNGDIEAVYRSEQPGTAWDDDIAILCYFATHYGHWYYFELWYGLS